MDDGLDHQTQLLPEDSTHARRSLLGAGLGGLLLMSGGLMLADTEPADAAKHRAKKRRRQRRRKDPGSGVLRNFALTIVNNSDRDWWFGVGWQGFWGADIEQRTVVKHSTRRLVVENDDASFFVPDGSTDEWGDAKGRLVAFINPSIGEVYLDSYSGVTYFLKSKSIHANTFDFESEQDMKVGGSRTFNFGFVSFVVHREQDSQKYKEFTITFS